MKEFEQKLDKQLDAIQNSNDRVLFLRGAKCIVENMIDARLRR